MAALLEPPVRESSVPDNLFDDLPEAKAAPKPESGIPDTLFDDLPAKPESKSAVPDTLFDDLPEPGPTKEQVETGPGGSLSGVQAEQPVPSYAPPKEQPEPAPASLARLEPVPGQQQVEESAKLAEHYDQPIFDLGSLIIKGPGEAKSKTEEGINASLRENINALVKPTNLGIIATMMGPGAAKATLPVGKAIAAWFAWQMGKQLPELGTQLGEELGKPKDQQDPTKIAKIISDGMILTAFTTAAGWHGIVRPAGERIGAIQKVPEPIAQLQAEALADAQGITLQQFEKQAEARGMSAADYMNEPMGRDEFLKLAQVENPAPEPGLVDSILAQTAPQTAAALAKTTSALRTVTGADLKMPTGAEPIAPLTKAAAGIDETVPLGNLNKPDTNRDRISPELQSAVERSVIPALHDHEILGSVISSVPVDMMNDFIGPEYSIQDVLRDPSVLTDRLTSNHNSPVAIRIYKETVAALRAKQSGLSKIARPDIEFISAELAKSEFSKLLPGEFAQVGAPVGTELSASPVSGKTSPTSETGEQNLRRHEGDITNVGEEVKKGKTYASSQQIAAKIHGDVLESQNKIESAGQVPVNESGQGVRAQQQPQVPAEPRAETSKPAAPDEQGQAEVKALKELGLTDEDISDLKSGKASVSDVVNRKLQPFEGGGGPDHAKALEEARQQAIQKIEAIYKPAPKPEPATETKPAEFQPYPEKPTSRTKDAVQAFGESVKKWRESVTNWLKDKPEDKPITWTTDSGIVRDLQKNSEGKWQVTSRKKNKTGEYYVTKKEIFDTREAALEAHAKKGNLDFQDRSSLGAKLEKEKTAPEPAPESKPITPDEKPRVREQVDRINLLTPEQFDEFSRSNSPERVGELFANDKKAMAALRGSKGLMENELKFKKRVKAAPEVLDAIQKKIDWLKKALDKAESDTSLEQRVGSKGKVANPLEMADEDLADYFDKKFGEPAGKPQPGEFGRQGTYTFPTYEAFRDWMNERYKERDLEGMKLAFAEAPTANKVKYAKAFGTGNVNPHLKSWVAHMATGADLPKEDGPVARTTPRPTPTGRPGGGAPQPSPGSPAQPPGRPAEPPPPPRPPSGQRKFNITALVQVMKQLGQRPIMNLKMKRALGRILLDTGQIELKSRLLWDQDLAARVIGHELGHFIDLFVPLIGKGKQFANRLAPLKDFQRTLFTKADLRDEARELSREWRGDFRNGDKYRDTAKELMADFMSAMFNDPEMVNRKYPNLHDAFQDLRDAKPEFKNAYREIETWLQGDTMAQELLDQDLDATKRSFDKIMEEKDRPKASWLEQLRFGTLSMWHRAFVREGKPRQIGSSLTEKLESSFIWADRKTAIWRDDLMKGIKPNLEKVDSDPVIARSYLNSYTKAIRTISERRAAGTWIESHPNESRDMLTHILGLDPGLREKFGNALADAPDSAMYDLSAAVFREVHDRGKQFVKRISTEINDLNLGVDGDAALMAFNVRGKLLNPGGETPEISQKKLDLLRDKLGPEKYKALEDAAAALHKKLFDLQKEMHDAGILSDKTFKELIEPNQNNYVPYAALDHFDGRVRAGVLPQQGTAMDVADVLIASELKAMSSYQWLQKQRQVQLLQQIWSHPLGENMGPINPKLEKLRSAADVEKVKNENKHDNISRSVIWIDGSPHLIEFGEDNGKMVEKALDSPSFYGRYGFFHDTAQNVHSLMQIFTQFSPRFMLWRNPIRGFMTAALKLGPWNVAKQVGGAIPYILSRGRLARGTRGGKNAILARNYADAAFGADLLPEVREMIDNEALPSPRAALGAVQDLPNMRELLEHNSLAVFEAERLIQEAGGGKANRIAEKFPAVAPQIKWTANKYRLVKNAAQRRFTEYEAFEKIYNYKAAIAKGFDPATASAISQRGGIPRPSVGGQWSSMVEIPAPFTRVKTQGTRATYEMMMDPRFRRGFIARFALMEALPRAAKVALGIGIIGKTISFVRGVFPGQEEENGLWEGKDSVIAEVLKRNSPYKMALDHVTPLWLYDTRTGKKHWFTEFKSGSEIPKHYEVVNLRIPSSEEGNLWGTLLYQAMTANKMGKPGATILSNLGDWAVNNLGPTVNPFAGNLANAYQMGIQGQNPQDMFRHQPVANPLLFTAGGTDRAQAIAGSTLNQLGGPGEAIGKAAAMLGILDPRSMNSLSQRDAKDIQPWYEKLPFTGAVLSHDNYAQYRDEKEEKLDQEKFRARAKLVMTPDVKMVYDFYWRNKDRQKKLDTVDAMRFELAAEFMKDVWGKLKDNKGEPDPDSFYSKTLHAVGKDGSKQAKETVKRDLEQASQIYVNMFKHVTQPEKIENKDSDKTIPIKYDAPDIQMPAK